MKYTKEYFQRQNIAIMCNNRSQAEELCDLLGTRIKLLWLWITHEYWRYGKAWSLSTFIESYKENELIKTLGKDKYLDMTKREILNTKV